MDLDFDAIGDVEDVAHVTFGNVSEIITAIGEMAWISTVTEESTPSSVYYLSRGTNECLQYNLESKE